MSYATIDELRGALGGLKALPADYVAKMLHALPAGAVVDRTVFLLQKVAGKRVLEFGASGPMHDGIVKAAASVIGVDRVDAPGVNGFDLDDVREIDLPCWDNVDVIICGEILEHLANPGHFLYRLKRQFPGVPVVLTVPNAYSAAAVKHLKRDTENVNIEHVAWYSPRTLRTLVERYGFTIREFAYYGGDGPTAEGLIAVVE